MISQPCVQIAVSKLHKYATRESGDTVEVVERPHGGLSAVLADGQRSGKSAKMISNLVVRKAISLLAEGVRDGAVARAAHDYLRTYRRGQVSAELQMVSLDLDSYSLLVTRNCHCPVWVRTSQGARFLDAESHPIGIHRKTRPDISELLIDTGTTVVLASDGVWEAGRLTGQAFDLPTQVELLEYQGAPTGAALARGLLESALKMDLGGARDDLTVLVLKVEYGVTESGARHMTVDFPLSPT